MLEIVQLEKTSQKYHILGFCLILIGIYLMKTSETEHIKEQENFVQDEVNESAKNSVKNVDNQEKYGNKSTFSSQEKKEKNSHCNKRMSTIMDILNDLQYDSNFERALGLAGAPKIVLKTTERNVKKSLVIDLNGLNNYIHNMEKYDNTYSNSNSNSMAFETGQSQIKSRKSSAIRTQRRTEENKYFDPGSSNVYDSNSYRNDVKKYVIKDNIGNSLRGKTDRLYTSEDRYSIPKTSSLSQRLRFEVNTKDQSCKYTDKHIPTFGVSKKKVSIVQQKSNTYHNDDNNNIEVPNETHELEYSEEVKNQFYFSNDIQKEAQQKFKGNLESNRLTRHISFNNIHHQGDSAYFVESTKSNPSNIKDSDKLNLPLKNSDVDLKIYDTGSVDPKQHPDKFDEEEISASLNQSKKPYSKDDERNTCQLLENQPFGGEMNSQDKNDSASGYFSQPENYHMPYEDTIDQEYQSQPVHFTNLKEDLASCAYKSERKDRTQTNSNFTGNDNFSLNGGQEPVKSIEDTDNNKKLDVLNDFNNELSEKSFNYPSARKDKDKVQTIQSKEKYASDGKPQIHIRSPSNKYFEAKEYSKSIQISNLDLRKIIKEETEFSCERTQTEFSEISRKKVPSSLGTKKSSQKPYNQNIDTSKVRNLYGDQGLGLDVIKNKILPDLGSFYHLDVPFCLRNSIKTIISYNIAWDTIIIDEDGYYYIGQVDDSSRKHGKGIYHWRDGMKFYEGDFVKGKMEGWGSYYHRNGVMMYQGSVHDNMLNGYGIKFDIKGYEQTRGYWNNGSLQKQEDISADELRAIQEFLNNEARYSGAPIQDVNGFEQRISMKLMTLKRQSIRAMKTDRTKLKRSHFSLASNDIGNNLSPKVQFHYK